MRSAKDSLCIAHANSRTINRSEPVTSLTSLTNTMKQFCLPLGRFCFWPPGQTTPFLFHLPHLSLQVGKYHLKGYFPVDGGFHLFRNFSPDHEKMWMLGILWTVSIEWFVRDLMGGCSIWHESPKSPMVALQWQRGTILVFRGEKTF